MITEAKGSVGEMWRNFSSTILQRAQSSRREKRLILVTHEISQVGAQLSFQEVKCPFCSLTSTETCLFSVSLDTLLEADCRSLPSTQVLLVLQAGSYPQIGLV